MNRPDGRTLAEPRPVEILTGFHRNAEGSVLYRAGSTAVLCTVSIDDGVPAWMTGRGTGWLTAEYQMHPRASPARREPRDGRGKAPSGRTQEIQRLIGRALRAAVDLDHLGERTLAVDCDVLEADGGTRTASITGGYVALALAIHRLRERGALAEDPIVAQVAAVSAGYVGGVALLDLDYSEDSTADLDCNVVQTGAGGVVEVQCTAEGRAISRAELNGLLDLIDGGIAQLLAAQRAILAQAGVHVL